MKFMRYSFLLSMFGILTFLAKGSVSGPCWVGWYQPEVPKSLRK